jgi:hypothetical protein
MSFNLSTYQEAFQEFLEKAEKNEDKCQIAHEQVIQLLEWISKNCEKEAEVKGNKSFVLKLTKEPDLVYVLKICDQQPRIPLP